MTPDSNNGSGQENENILQNISIGAGQTVYAVLLSFVVIITLLVPIYNDWIPENFTGDYILSIVLVAVTAFSLSINNRLWSKINKLKGEIEEADAYQYLIDEKNTSAVRIRKKEMIIEISEDGPDDITYSFELESLEDNTIDEYIGLIGTDREYAWEDLNFSTNDAGLKQQRRRDFDDLRRFVVEMELHEEVSNSYTYPLDYGISADVVDPESDKAFLLVREPTDYCKIDIILPSEWKPQRKIASGREELEIPDLNEPDRELDDEGNWHIKWECNDCEVGHSYEIDYTATKSSE